MRATSAKLDIHEVRRSIHRLAGLPIRPSVARQVFAVLDEDHEPSSRIVAPGTSLMVPATETDPAWALARSRAGVANWLDPASVLIEHPWWGTAATSPAGLDALNRLWRHSVAVAFSARRLAREANDPEADLVGRAGLLHHLGLWALAAVDPDRLAEWIEGTAEERLALENHWFGTPITAIGRQLAERWEVEPLVIDATWLHADVAGDLNACASDPVRLALIQRGYAQSRRTPWSLDPDSSRDLGPTDPRVRILTAEVQSRCGAPFVEPDASSREERLTRENLQLRRDLARSDADRQSHARLVAALAESSPRDHLQTWADRAALAWCQEPGVVAARVVLRSDSETELDSLANPAHSPARPIPDRSTPTTLPLGDPTQPVADLWLWTLPDVRSHPSRSLLDGWNGWARAVADRQRIVSTLDRAVLGYRDRIAADEVRQRRSKLEALAEFAAGAGHELNNPLAVIMGRAQLLLARSADEETTRSLRAIIAQAQRAHRILRDLMYVARPPEFRPRACQPDEIVRACLRDLESEAKAQGIRLVHDVREPSTVIWADPDSLRQVADILTRNALEASSAGSQIRFSTGSDTRGLRWVVHDSGRGIASHEGAHLFDPFFCGRQAGRGLGLGLPRVARIVDQAGGDLRWQSHSGQGSTFQVILPVEEIPPPIVPVMAPTPLELLGKSC